MDSTGSVEQTSDHLFAAKPKQRSDHMPSDTMLSSTVLVLEDDNIVAEVIADCLRDHGYPTLRARSPEDALREVRQRSIGLVLLGGVPLARGGGEALVRELRAHSPHARLPMIVISDDKSALAAADQIGVEDYLPSAFEIGDLLHLVDEHCT